MLYWYLLFFFLAFGAKVLLALTMIYLLLPTDRRCSQCDEETILVRPSRLGRIGARISLGRVVWRWCPACGWEGMARRGPEPTRPSQPGLGSITPTRR